MGVSNDEARDITLKVPFLSSGSDNKVIDEDAVINEELPEESLLKNSQDKEKTESVDDGQAPISFCCTPQFKVYISHFLSSWGDRMWMFAGGFFLIEITPGSLRLVAIYEAALSLTVIFFGSAIGRWIDRTSRLRAAQTSLIIQNLMVCVCTVLLCFLISYKAYFSESLNGWGAALTEAAVVFLACVAQMGSLGSKLAIEKDWIIVISEDKNVKLSTMNSVLRTVDLSTELMAPVLVGLVMAWAGMVVGGIVIATWNVTSLVFEYGLLHHLYYKVPALQKSKQTEDSSSRRQVRGFLWGYLKNLQDKARDAAVAWGHYFTHTIRDAGLALAFLYMTVLAFDNYSRAYVYQMGINKDVLGILTAFASLWGICGSIAFPHLRTKIGVLKTGILGFAFETSCLLLCVASVFAPGTCFKPLLQIDSRNIQITPMASGHSFANQFHSGSETPLVVLSLANNSDPDSIPSAKSSLENEERESSNHRHYTSVALLLTGIITSRCGLWIADLTVTQLLQEQVSEDERGGINGVQSSLNQSFSLLRSILLIILPTVETFGYLIILSFIFVAIATAMFCTYAYKSRKRTLILRKT